MTQLNREFAIINGDQIKLSEVCAVGNVQIADNGNYEFYLETTQDEDEGYYYEFSMKETAQYALDYFESILLAYRTEKGLPPKRKSSKFDVWEYDVNPKKEFSDIEFNKISGFTKPIANQFWADRWHETNPWAVFVELKDDNEYGEWHGFETQEKAKLFHRKLNEKFHYYRTSNGLTPPKYDKNRKMQVICDTEISQNIPVAAPTYKECPNGCGQSLKTCGTGEIWPGGLNKHLKKCSKQKPKDELKEVDIQNNAGNRNHNQKPPEGTLPCPQCGKPLKAHMKNGKWQIMGRAAGPHRNVCGTNPGNEKLVNCPYGCGKKLRADLNGNIFQQVLARHHKDCPKYKFLPRRQFPMKCTDVSLHKLPEKLNPSPKTPNDEFIRCPKCKKYLRAENGAISPLAAAGHKQYCDPKKKAANLAAGPPKKIVFKKCIYGCGANLKAKFDPDKGDWVPGSTSQSLHNHKCAKLREKN